MEEVLFSLGIFVLLYLFYLITVICRKQKLDKFMEGAEVTYLKRRYNLSLKKVSKKLLANIIALTNSFVISLTCLSLVLIKNYILKLMVAFIILVPLIIISYHIIGTILKRKER
ncbi:MAG: hypothetical protein E7169_00350 [Firmicutes bacterium]|nr:hypothetical protein [Bacillota bacterium]